MAKAPKAVSRLNMCKAFIHKAFHEVWFQDKELKTLMHDCYLDNIDDMMSFAMENDMKLYDYFTFSILHSGGVYHINSWSTGAPLGFILMFNNNRRQVKRLEEFCEKCNQYFNSRQK